MLFDVGRASGTKLCRLLKYELGGDRAVIIVSALVARPTGSSLYNDVY